MSGKERSIICDGREVRGLLDGTITQLRRPVSPQPMHIEWFAHQNGWCGSFRDNGGSPDDPAYKMVSCPFGVPGELLWCKESVAVQCWRGSVSGRVAAECQPDEIGRCSVFYRADGERPPAVTVEVAAGMINGHSGWRQPTTMPRWASRITLRVVDVRVERLKEIQRQDAFACGVEEYRFYSACKWFHPDDAATSELCGIWDDRYGNRYPASGNPWVWVANVERVNDE